MTKHNRIAVYGHRGWASSAIVRALSDSGAPITILHRASSDTHGLPSGVKRIQVDINNREALVAALQDIDIFISLVGHEGVQSQHAFVEAIPHTHVQLFCPSDLAARYDEQGLQIPVNKAKDEVERAAKEAGIPTTVVLPGNFAEFALNTKAMGVDIPGNRIIFTGDSAECRLNLCTRDYVAAAYASIFAATPISQLRNRSICLTELSPTGDEIAKALEEKNAAPPKTIVHSLEKVNNEIKSCLQSGSPFALPWYCRKIWGNGKQASMVGSDVWNVGGCRKVGIRELIIDGQLEPYRDLPPQVGEYFESIFV
ncbi:hypothetical protein N8I77_008931 [Diaporthe amygdali]|uniref:NmrA-like domain-containing protein n=1 Tax=Phomopsis amygdali TaxID=1214568 RepID=A0AAD9S8L2_PHOAM|nr:hypothetical protein N8I77_008931 [Diaporthe amygdali]